MSDTFLEFVKGLESADNVTSPTLSELASEARPFGRPTVDGGIAFFSTVRNRSSGQTVIVGDRHGGIGRCRFPPPARSFDLDVRGNLVRRKVDARDAA